VGGGHFELRRPATLEDSALLDEGRAVEKRFVAGWAVRTRAANEAGGAASTHTFSGRAMGWGELGVEWAWTGL